jgi:GNAT superfamily N-acetyltransferase
MDRLAEYAQSFPGMVDEDFIAAGFSPDEVYSYRINQQAQSETARARELASMQEQRRARGQALAAQYPDYFRQGLETEPLYGIDQRMSDIKAGAELTQDPNFARRQFARLATDLGLPLSLAESALGLAELTPYGSFASGFDVAASIPQTAEYLREGEYGRAALSGAGGVLAALDVIGTSLPITVPAALAVSKIDTGKLAADVVGTGRALVDMDLEFLRGRGNPALAQGVGADVPGPPPLTFDEVEAAMKAEAPQISISETIKSKYPDVKIDLFGNPEKGYELSRIVVPKEGRSSGVGTQVMEDIIQMADAQGAKVSLTPDTEFGGTSVSRLKDFYKRFGFVENKGRNKDFSTRNTMYRNPQSTAPAKPTAAELRRQANIQRFGYDPNETPATVDTSYRGGHQPRGPQDENPVRLDDITISTTGESAGYPSDFYGPSGSRYYAPGPRFADDEFGVANQQSYRAIMKAKGNPDAEVTIYRAVPNEDSITSINEGDFVTLSPKYAEIHGSEGYGPNGNDAGKVISQKVKVKDIYFAGDDVNEFGYYPSGGNVSDDVPFGGPTAPQGIKAYQGSPHDFAAERLVRYPDGSTEYIVGSPDVLPDIPAGAEVLEDFPFGRTRMDKIGTGEGAQAYGHGMYVAEAEDVAKGYKDNISSQALDGAQAVLQRVGGDVDAAIADRVKSLSRFEERYSQGDIDDRLYQFMKNLGRGQIEQLKQYKKQGYFSKGHMYELNIDSDPADFLDWDAPLSAQPAWQKVRRRWDETLGDPDIIQERLGIDPENTTGGDYMSKLGSGLTGQDVAISAQLREAGIPGIKYLDAGSRGTSDATRNFVVFDEKLISIVKKYGIAGAATMLGVSALDVEQALADNLAPSDWEDLVAGPQ